MEYNKVINGIMRFIEKEMLSGMNDWQEMVSRIALSRFVKKADAFKTVLMENSFLRTFAIIDASGNVDVNGLVADLKEQVRKKGTIELSLSILGNFKFVEADVDKLHQYVIGAL